MHQLVRPGPLLHASREQRATRARAPDLSLTFHVVGDLPWLQASLLGMPATMLQGEVVPASLLLVNRGRAPAGDILLRSSLAWLVVGSASAILPVGHSASVPTEAAPPEAQPTTEGRAPVACAVGSTGRLWRAMVRDGNGATAVPLVLQPGEGVMLPLWLRGDGGGKQTLRLVVQYLPCNGDGVLAKPPTKTASWGTGHLAPSVVRAASAGAGAPPAFARRVRLCAELLVLPSVSVSATVRPSYDRATEHVLSVQLTNYRSDGDVVARDVRARHICMFSDAWELRPFGTAAESMDVVKDTSGALCGALLRWQERITLHYRLLPRGEARAGSAHGAYCSEWAVDTSEQALGASTVGPSLNLLCVEHAALQHRDAAAELQRERALSRASEEGGGDQPRSIQAIRRDANAHSDEPSHGEGEPDAKGSGDGQRESQSVAATSPASLCSGAPTIALAVLWEFDPAQSSASGEAASAEPLLDLAAASATMTQTRSGQHHVLALPIIPTPEASRNRRCPLTLTLQYASKLTHDFGPDEQRSAELPIVVSVTNRLCESEGTPCDFVFEVTNRPERTAATADGVAPAARGGASANPGSVAGSLTMWLGTTRKSVRQLAPGKTTQIRLRACFLGPGVFDLNAFRVTMAAAGSQDSAGAPPPSISFSFPTQYLITVEKPH